MQRWVKKHRFDRYLRGERMPHIWCPGCGNGIILSCLLHAIERLKLDLDKISVVSGIGCIGRAPGYLKFDSFHVLHGRAIPFAVGLKLVRPELCVIVLSGDGDLFAIGGNHFIHAARRNNDLLVICSNNFNYGMTGGQAGPTTPHDAITTTSPYGNIELPLNLPFFAVSCGATYVARWTAWHVRELAAGMAEALQRRGFRFIEVLSPCPPIYGRRNRMARGVDMMRYFQKQSVTRHFEDAKGAEIRLGGKILVGKFADKEKKTYEEKVAALIKAQTGER
jgi:2-oxoglutarate ferredoxin oxidoreductase subunit beta